MCASYSPALGPNQCLVGVVRVGVARAARQPHPQPQRPLRAHWAVRPHLRTAAPPTAGCETHPRRVLLARPWANNDNNNMGQAEHWMRSFVATHGDTTMHRERSRTHRSSSGEWARMKAGRGACCVALAFYTRAGAGSRPSAKGRKRHKSEGGEPSEAGDTRA